MGTAIPPILKLAPQPVTLRDGTQLMLRPIFPEDAHRLQAFHQRLSPETIYLRYMEFHKVLSDAEAAHLCNVDYHNRMAFVATCFDDGDEVIVGVIRYDKVGKSPSQSAEVAVLIADDYQRRGLGSLLFSRLVNHARLEGIGVFTAAFLFENSGFLNLVRHSGLRMALRADDVGTYEAHILLNNAYLN